MKRLLLFSFLIISISSLVFSRVLYDAFVEVNHDDHILIMKSLPQQVNGYLKKHLSKYVIPLKSDVERDVYGYISDEDILNHPSFCQGDFNSDGLTDYAMILTYYDNEAILVILNQRAPETLWYDLYVVGLVSNYTEEFISFDETSLIRGTIRGITETITWDELEDRYKVSPVTSYTDAVSI